MRRLQGLTWSFVVLSAGLLLPSFQMLAAEPVKEQPIVTFAIIGNPYLTTLSPDQIKDERGSNRGFLAKTAPAALKKSIAIVNELKPDAVIVLGSATWSGSKADFDAFKVYLDQIESPVMVAAGDRDELGGGLGDWRGILGSRSVTNSVREVAGVRLFFADDLVSATDKACDRIEEQVAQLGEKFTASLLISARPSAGAKSSKLKNESRFWSLVEKQRVAVELAPTRYGHQISLNRSLPRWTVGSVGWATRGAVTRVRVFKDRIELAEYLDPDTPVFVLNLPNPVAVPRLSDVEKDPYRCLSYTTELAKKPDFTVALISDPQFDRERSRDTLLQKARDGVADLNRLKPDLVLITGDLVNNNLPEEWDLFNEVFSKLEPKYYTMPGNHDVLFNYDFVESMYASAPEKNPEYAAQVKEAVQQAAKEGFKGPSALYEKYTGSPTQQVIKIKDAAFITLPFLTQRAEPEDLAYLRQQLEATQGIRHVFVAAHYPVLPVFGNNLLPEKGGDEVLALLKKYSVTGFLFGHRHRNGFAMSEGTAHVLTDNMSSIHLLHVHKDRIVIGRKKIGAALYETLTIPVGR